jgi:hypothetical protein
LAFIFASNALAAVDLSWTPNNTISWGSSDIWQSVQTIWFRFLSTAKWIFQWILLIIIVYAGARMIMSMWTDEEDLSKAKRILWYSLIGLVFINIPWTLYMALRWGGSTAWNVWGQWNWAWENLIWNLFVNTDYLIWVLNTNIVNFLKVILVSLAVIVIILSWMKIVISRWSEETLKKSRTRIIWAIIWLVFVWFIQAWQTFIYRWEISDGRNIFETLANLLLFLAVPIAVFFLTLAGYYYITANWDEEKTKKWKNIIIHTLIWTLILLIAYVFLYDLNF